jgi:WD40 repeat protein
MLSTNQQYSVSRSRVALSADRLLLAGGDTDGMVRLWETRTGRLLAALKGHTAEVHGVALSAEGNLLASGSADGTARFWDTGTRQPVGTCRAGVIWGVVLSADGQLLVSGGTDGTVRLWETRTGQPVATLQGHTGTIRSVALSADGQLVASRGEDAAVRLWAVGTGRLVQCSHSTPVRLTQSCQVTVSLHYCAPRGDYPLALRLYLPAWYLPGVRHGAAAASLARVPRAAGTDG